MCLNYILDLSHSQLPLILWSVASHSLPHTPLPSPAQYSEKTPTLVSAGLLLTLCLNMSHPMCLEKSADWSYFPWIADLVGASAFSRSLFPQAVLSPPL